MRNLKQNRSLPKGRGASIQPANPYLEVREEPDLEQVAEDSAYLNHRQRPPTIYHPDQSLSIVSENDSPNIPFRYSLNPYRGCKLVERTCHSSLIFTENEKAGYF